MDGVFLVGLVVLLLLILALIAGCSKLERKS